MIPIPQVPVYEASNRGATEHLAEARPGPDEVGVWGGALRQASGPRRLPRLPGLRGLPHGPLHHRAQPQEEAVRINGSLPRRRQVDVSTLRIFTAAQRLVLGY